MDQSIERKILDLLDSHRIMTLATLRPDGWPQATTVGYAHDGMTLYFVCDRDSQKVANIAQNDRVSLTIDHDTSDMADIVGLSMAAHASPVNDHNEAEKALRMFGFNWPEQAMPEEALPSSEEIQVYRVTPTLISVLDYSKGFGHTDLVSY
ncbi:MAG: pyridoxamine 5'-phosphate oxidase family protein [Gammaproteobacteria bacterium]|nr:pyridoxamine 5'-phosphate oxidase family protein [Gammaproteobacteria bacterium]